MAIKARCGGCGTSFQAKDSLAGKRVKCPKCAAPLTVPSSKAGQVAKGAAVAGAAKAHNPLLDLLDEVNVKSATRGPSCPSCGGAMPTSAIVCVNCGYNVETGMQIATSIHADDDDDGGGVADVGMTDAEKIMAKAEREIEDTPVTARGQDFGDGADSFLIAGISAVILLILIGIGLTVIFTMDIISTKVASWFISFIAAVIMILAMSTWITIVAFLQKPGHGIACVLTAGLWCVVYGFMQGRQLIFPTIVLLGSFIVGAASGVYTMYKGIKPGGGP